MIPLTTTHHATARLRQRGVRDDVATAAFDFADREVELGDGKVALSLTRRALKRLRAARGAAIAERAKSLVLVVADNTLVSVIRHGGRRGRCYVSSH
jgi:hypothetical protein